jgi:uncharacterized protein YdhG (YjbR/CyaY superfamily)
VADVTPDGRRMIMPKAKPKTVDEYVTAVPEAGRKHVREIRAILKRAAPKAKETLKWGQPAYEAERILFAFAAFKSHLNFSPTPSVIRQFKKELAKYETGKGSIRFPYDEPLPKGLIRKLAALRVKELREKDAKWM